MKRIALLVGGPGWPNRPGFLPGVQPDIANYYAFLRSPTGGAWAENEIVRVGLNPDRDQLLKRVRQLRADYVLVIFSGHGAIDVRTQQQIISLNPTQRVPLRDIVPSAPRMLVIVDACRVFEHISGLAGLQVEALRSFPSNLTPLRARQLFDQLLTECPLGHATCYACGPGQTSLDTEVGGMFSTALLDVVTDWVSSPSLEDWLPIEAAFGRAKSLLAAQPSVLQRPKMRVNLQPSQPVNLFPFALRESVQLLRNFI